MSPDEHYPEHLTAQSLAVAEELLATYPEATMIGGWATWKRVGTMRSHDIDLIVAASVRNTIAQHHEVTPSTHIGGRKWRTRIDDIHVDLYVPYQSELGERLQLRVERLLPFREMVDGWPLLDVPAQVATKLAALVDRPESLPGQKDRSELVRLLALGPKPGAIADALRSSAADLSAIARVVGDAWTYLDDLPLPRAQRARLRALGRKVQQALTGS